MAVIVYIDANVENDITYDVEGATWHVTDKEALIIQDGKDRRIAEHARGKWLYVRDDNPTAKEPPEPVAGVTWVREGADVTIQPDDVETRWAHEATVNEVHDGLREQCVKCNPAPMVALEDLTPFPPLEDDDPVKPTPPHSWQSQSPLVPLEHRSPTFHERFVMADVCSTCGAKRGEPHKYD